MRRICEAGDVVDVVIITPEPGRAKEIGQKLLALADYPQQVQWVTWPSAGFSIPLELFAKFDADGEDGAAPAAPVDEESAPPRRRGRPRRQEVESTDDTATSPEEE